MLDRRSLIKLGLYGGAGGLLHLTRLKSGGWAWALDEDHRSEDEIQGTTNTLSSFPQTFNVGLPLPPVAKKVNPLNLPGIPIYNDGVPTSYYEVRERQAPVQIFPGGQGTVIWGFNGGSVTPGGQTWLGPTFVAKIGERVVIRMHNSLGPNINSIVHHHGAHVGSQWDGSALWSQQIHNGTFKDFVYPNDDDIAATHWYHDHDIDFTGHNVFMGLEGFFLLHDAHENNLNLPGAPPNALNPLGDPTVANPQVIGGHELPFDLPLVIQDRTFDSNLQLVYNPFSSRGFLGNKFCINGAIQPNIRVANRKYRLRILNGSNARLYHLMLVTNTGATLPFHIIGSDGGLYHKAVEVNGFQIAPAERVEVIVDFSQLPAGVGMQVFLNNCLAQTDGRKPSGLVSDCTTVPQIPGFDGVGTLGFFNIDFSAHDPSSFTPGQILRTDPPVLPDFYKISEALPPVNSRVKPGATRAWQFDRGSGGEWLVDSFNGLGALPFDPGPLPPLPETPRIDATCKAGTTEIWRLINGSGGWVHPVHIHRNQFKIIDRVDSGSGQSLGLLPTQLGFKDVFILDENVSIRLITKYTSGPTSDKQLGKYVMHCHNVEHEDMAMMIVWQVVT